MTRNRSHRLHRRNNVFYFRAVVPTQWRKAFKKAEIKFSLQTTDRMLANIRCRALSNAFDRFFGGNNMAQIPLDRIHAVAQAYFQECLNKALELTFNLPEDENIDIDFEIQGSVDRIAALRIMLKKQQYDDIVEIDARELLEKISNGSPADDALIYIRKLVARAKLLQNEYLVQELSGSTYNGAPDDPIYKNILPKDLPDWEATTSSHTQSLSAAIETYITLKDTAWVNKTKDDQKRCLYLAKEVIGADRPLSTINADDMRHVRDTLMKMPSNAFKAKSSSGKTLSEIIKENKDGKILSFKTRDKYFMMIRSFFKWAVDEELISKMPGSNIVMMGAPKETAIDERYPYDESELRRIFTSPLYTGCKSLSRRSTPGEIIERDDYYWIPIVALYTGMRLGEIIQLRLTDLKLEDGIHYFDVSLDDDQQKTVKTATSIRRIPVHPILITLGLLSYAATREKHKRQRLFDDIQPSEAGYYSGNFSKWWGRYTRKIGVQTAKTAFHSFRHNFTDALREAEIPEDISRQLTGHADKAGDSHARYGTKASLKRLRDGISKISYGEIDQVLNQQGNQE